VELPSGKLGVHEEFPDEVAEAVKSFLTGFVRLPSGADAHWAIDS
jgi:hypothetical protein